MSRKIKLVSIDGDGCLFAYTNIGSAFHSSWDAVAFAYGLKETWDARAKKYAGHKNRATSGHRRTPLTCVANRSAWPRPRCIPFLIATGPGNF